MSASFTRNSRALKHCFGVRSELRFEVTGSLPPRDYAATLMLSRSNHSIAVSVRSRIDVRSSACAHLDRQGLRPRLG